MVGCATHPFVYTVLLCCVMMFMASYIIARSCHVVAESERERRG